MRSNLSVYNVDKHKRVLDTLVIGNTVTRTLKSMILNLITAYWDVFDPDGIRKNILGYEYKMDTGTNKGVCCRPPRYGHYEGGIIMQHIKSLTQ